MAFYKETKTIFLTLNFMYSLLPSWNILNVAFGVYGNCSGQLQQSIACSGNMSKIFSKSSVEAIFGTFIVFISALLWYDYISLILSC